MKTKSPNSKVFILIVCTTAAFQFAKAQSPSSSNTLGSTGITSIASTTATAFQLSINGAAKFYGTGYGTGVPGTVVTSPSLFLHNTSTGAKEYLINSGDDGFLHISDAAEGTSFTATDRLVIDPTGLVGIGTSAPAQKLSINGNFGYYSNIYRNGLLYIHEGATYSQYFGYDCGNLSATGYDNTCYGRQSMNLVTTGAYNTCFGKATNYYNVTGYYNISVGHNTGVRVVTIRS